MSTKDLFDKKYLAQTNQKDAFSEVESADNFKALATKKNTFIPQVDYSDPQTFARFGSGRLYYKAAIERILDFYPYDGSDAEINNFYNKSLDIEKYIFDKKYPRTNGYAVMSSNGWGTLEGSISSFGYGKPSSLEYIEFKGGPNTISETLSLQKLAPDDKNSKFQYSNVYDEDIYTNAGLISNYGSGSRVSNLDSDFDRGVTVEFWAKTGSLSTSLTQKQVVLDMWNNELSSSANYGRLTIDLDGTAASGTPWRISVNSGANGISSQPIGENINLDTLSNWGHYAFVLQNTGSVFRVKLYVNGDFNHARDFNSTATTASLGTLNPRNMMGRLGSLMTAPSGAAGNGTELAYHAGAGKLNGSIDEFRFWKIGRDAQEIGRNWFTQVRGGVNTDIANTTLGLYYKFNEGITTSSSLDSVVLDYGGRICNGAWTGYSSTSRNTGSAIISASAAAKEYEDPIIYATHADVVSLKKELTDDGINHDGQNNSMFMNLLPSWIVEESEEQGNSDLEKLSHIVGSYFDKLYLQISSLPSFRHATYTSSSYKPLPFSQHLPQSLGLDTPELFVDATVMERFAGRTDKEHFEADLEDTKNLIYQNLYNNLAAIFKSKGTERSIRNVFRCFNIDDNLVYLNTYAKNQTYLLKNNLKQTQKRNTFINFNEPAHLNAVVYQDVDPYYAAAVTRGFISGTNTIGYEDTHGLTAEASIMFPKFVKNFDKVHREFKTVSLFGMQSASSDASYPGTTTYDSDGANFQVFAVRDAPFSKNAYFKLTSSNSPFPFNFNLTSSTYRSLYNDESWNISVSLRPAGGFQSFGLVSGSNIKNTAHDPDKYDVVFRGYNNKLGELFQSFELTSSITKTVAQTMLRANKRLYIGARNENITGSNLNSCDVLFRGAKYWTKYVDNYTLKQHTFDRENAGISRTYEYTDFLPHDAGTPLANTTNYSHNFNTLALNWYFGNITGSDASGNFYSNDLSSGSIAAKQPDSIQRDYSGMAGKISEYIHGGKGAGFLPSSTTVVETKLANEYKFINPEYAISSDMVKLQSDEDELFENNEAIDEIPNHLFSIEKSLNAALSEEILDFFAGAIDFNNLIGDPVNRYRMEYKEINFLRRIFFEKFNDIAEAEKYIEYFKWFDDALIAIITQLLPASSDIQGTILNLIESHVLERNKYQTQFPTLEFKPPDPAASARGFWEKYASYIHFLFGGTEASPRPTDEHKDFWLKRAQPGPQGTGDYEITSDDPKVDQARIIIRNQMHQRPEFSGSAKIFKTTAGQRYMQNALLDSQLAGVVALQGVTLHRPIKGGVNFGHNKDIHYTYTSLYPAGPVHTGGGVYIPQNVLYAETKDFEPIEPVKLALESRRITTATKRKRYVKVVQGRDYDGGRNYTANQSSFAFPFNIMSGAISGGVDNLIRERVTGGISLANLHNDVYGDDMEVPLQGPFTERVVGGHQSRHIGLNVSRSAGKNHGGTLYNGLDDYTSRPEAWKILLGKRGDCPTGAEQSGAIGMVGADYPWPEANDVGANPYPMTASQKAVYYRDHIAKRPVNIRNIEMGTGSVLPNIGNYSHQYEILHSFGADMNPRNFVENQPALPPETFQNLATSSTQTRTFLDIHRHSVPRDPAGPTDATENHFQFMSEFNASYLSGTKNRSIITTRFSPAGGMLTDGNGYRDFKSNEYSVYAAKNYTDLTVIKPWQGSKGTVSEKHGVGTAGIRVSDIHHRDYGLTSHYARHTAKFGRDSLIYPLDSEREVYNLAKDFVGYDDGVYRSAYALKGWWRMNANISSAGDATDESGNGRDGDFDAVGERPDFETLAGLFPSKWVQTGSCKFDPADTTAINIGTAPTWDPVIGNDTANGSTQKMTLAAWVYKAGDGGGNYGRIFHFGTGSAPVALYTDVNETIWFDAPFSSTEGRWYTNTGVITTGTSKRWHHVVLTYDATSISNDPQIYVDGQKLAVTEQTTPAGNYSGITAGADSSACYIGNRSDGLRTWEGNLADAAVWNTILSDEDITAIFNASKLSDNYGPGTTYDQLPGFHKTHRNNLRKITRTERLVPVYSPAVSLTNLGGTQVSSSTSGIAGNNNPTFLLTGSHTDEGPATAAPALLAGLSGSGLSWTGWLKFDAVYAHNDPASETKEDIWSIGLGTSSKIKAKLEKVKAGSGDHRFQMRFTVATLGGPSGDIEYNWQFPAATYDLSSSWNHYALVWGTPGQGAPVNGTLDTVTNFLTSATLYFNGISQSAFNIDAGTPRPNYDNRTGAKSSYRNFSSLKVTGSSYMNIAGGLNTADDRLSASIDEFTFWTTPLYTSSITEIYNSGIPCDITASTLYSNSSSAMWDWLRFEEGPDTHSSLNINAANPGTYNSSTNNLVGFKNNQFLPLDASGQQTGMTFAAGAGPAQNILLPGCTRVLARYDTLYDFKTEENDYDNFFIQRPIPRSTTQYRWISSSITQTSGSREFGYVKPDYTYRITSSAGAVSYVEPLNFITASDVGSTNNGTNMDNIFGFDRKAVDKYGSKAWLPVDFSRLNTIIYEPLTASSNTLGYPLSIKFGEPGTPLESNQTGSYFNDIYIDSISRNRESDQAIGTVAVAGLNSLLLNRNGPYGWVPFKQIRQRNHPILRNERKNNIISIKNEFNLPGSDKYGTSYAGSYAIPYNLNTYMNNIDTGGKDNVYNAQDNLQGWWRFNTIPNNSDYTKNVSSDSSGNGRNAFVSPAGNNPGPTAGSVEFGHTPNPSIQTSSFVFNSHGATVNIGTAETWDTVIGRQSVNKQMTLHMWALYFYQTDRSNLYPRLFDFGGQDVAVFLGNGTQTGADPMPINFSARWNGSVVNWQTENNVVKTAKSTALSNTSGTGDWTHVMVTYNGNSTSNEPTIYYNGISQSIKLTTSGPSGIFSGIVGTSGSKDCYIGNNSSSVAATGPSTDYRRFYGYIADPAIWDITLDSNDARALYLAGYTGSTGLMSITSKPNSAIEKTAGGHLDSFALRPVSMKGRPVFINMDYANAMITSRDGLVEKRENASFKTSYNNEEIFFNEQKFNKLMKVNKDLVVTPFEQLVSTQHNYNSQVNWILYSENVFPSHRMEFASESVSRTFYDNKFWKNDQATRVSASVGYELKSSMGAYNFAVYQNGGTAGLDLSTFASQQLTQSIWPLDAPLDFETRTKPPEITTYLTGIMPPGYFSLSSSLWNGGPLYAYMGSSLLVSNSAGELQNTYSSYGFTNNGPPSSSLERLGYGLSIRNAALYSRKHMLSSPISISPPSSIQNINKTISRAARLNDSDTPGFPDFIPTYGPGDGPTSQRFGITQPFAAFFPAYAKPTASIDAAIGIGIDPYYVGRNPAATGSGEAKWEAPALAGYLTTSNGVTGFVKAPSSPWYNDYDEFRQDIKAIAKGYAVIPEFRISEKVEDYYKFGPQGAENFDLFSIPGTTQSSSSPQFYKDYSNSDFMENFLDIKQLSDLSAKEIRVTCHAAIKFNPYKGFYPVQRTQDIVSQFSKSYGSSVVVTDGISKIDNDDVLGYSYSRALTRPLFAPGILYNSIKAGIAVDYPIVTIGDRVHATHVTGSPSSNFVPENWLIGASAPAGIAGPIKGQVATPTQYTTGSFFDQRVPFEAILEPAKSLLDVYICDIEPHPSMSIGFNYGVASGFENDPPGFGLSASISSPPADKIYNLMASNFFAEVGKFFLKDSTYTKLESNGVATNNLKFGKDEIFGARLKIKTSYTGSRTYDEEFDSNGARSANFYAGPSFYAENGCRGVLSQRTGSEGLKSSGSFPIPQDPAFSADFKHDFVMYNRTTAFGPPMIGRPYAYAGMTSSLGLGAGSGDFPLEINRFALSASYFGHKDSINGYNWAYTPPYHNGEAWIDFIFLPTASEAYDLQRILAETQIVKRRFDPGPPLSASNANSAFTIDQNNSPFSRALVRDRPLLTLTTGLGAPYDDMSATGGNFAVGNALNPSYGQPYSGPNINKNAMQLDASLNLFGVENVFKKQVDKFGNEILSENEVIGQKWIIQPKFETPMANFSDVGIRPITSSTNTSENTLTLPTNFGSESVPRGMWHQFGVLPETPEKGIFMEMTDIPKTWLENHYEVFDYASPYNDFDTSKTYSEPVSKKMKSFASLLGFTAENSTARLGELKDKHVIKEAVVAVPYIIEGLQQRETQIETGGDQKDPSVQQRKKFINIPKNRVLAARKEAQGSLAGDSLSTAGASIRRLLSQMEDYILPPQFDFLNNTQIEPIVMYMFEFKYELDKDDLSYIWQNLAPRNSDKMEMKKYSVAHELMNTELLTEKNLLTSDNLRWMVFKVKQKSQTSYSDLIPAQAGQAAKLSRQFMKRKEAPYKFNWPYDFVSIVESVKIDVEVMYKDDTSVDKLKLSGRKLEKQFKSLNKKQRRKKDYKVAEKNLELEIQVASPAAKSAAKKAAVSKAKQGQVTKRVPRKTASRKRVNKKKTSAVKKKRY